MREFNKRPSLNPQYQRGASAFLHAPIMGKEMRQYRTNNDNNMINKE